MKLLNKVFCIILVALSTGFALYSAQCPSWEVITYTRFQCRNYGGVNFYVAGENAQYAPDNDQIQRPGQPLANGISKDPNVSYYGWWYCDSLSDSARIAICEKDFVYCADQSSGMLKYDTVLILDTIVKKIEKFDTVKISVYDTNKISIFDTTRHNILDTIVYVRYDTVVNRIVRNDTIVKIDTNVIVLHDTIHDQVTKVDTMFNYDTLRFTVLDTVIKQVFLYDTTEISFEKSFNITVDLPKIRKHRAKYFI